MVRPQEPVGDKTEWAKVVEDQVVCCCILFGWGTKWTIPAVTLWARQNYICTCLV